MRTPKRLTGFALLAFVAAAGAGCGALRGGPAPASQVVTSPKLNPTVYFEDGETAFFGVDGRAAQYVKEGTLFPLGIGLANRSKGTLTFTRESFVLEDSEGKKYPLASYEEFQPYTRSRSDERMLDAFAESMRARFGNFSFASFEMFPRKDRTVPARDRVELGRTTWTVGYLYFPIPPGGIHGKAFSLLIRVKEVPETFVVRFSLR